MRFFSCTWCWYADLFWLVHVLVYDNTRGEYRSHEEFNSVISLHCDAKLSAVFTGNMSSVKHTCIDHHRRPADLLKKVGPRGSVKIKICNRGYASMWLLFQNTPKHPATWLPLVGETAKPWVTQTSSSQVKSSWNQHGSLEFSKEPVETSKRLCINHWNSKNRSRNVSAEFHLYFSNCFTSVSVTQF